MLIRNPKKLVRPGQWVLAKIPPDCWIARHSYEFRDVEAAYVFITAQLIPDYRCQYGKYWLYSAAYRIPGRHIYKGDDGYMRYSHDRQYRTRIEDKDKDQFTFHKDGDYETPKPEDFGFVEYNRWDHPVYDEQESKRRDTDGQGGFLYEPASDDPKECPGGDYSLYYCGDCQKWVEPFSLDDGSLACPKCSPELRGLVYDTKVADQLDRARALASYVDTAYGYLRNPLERSSRESLERSLAWRNTDTHWSRPGRCNLYAEDKFSFYFVDQAFSENKKWERSMNGGIIMHGPHVKIGDDGAYEFTTWDYELKCSRPSKPEEIAHIDWSTHT